VAHKPFIEPHL